MSEADRVRALTDAGLLHPAPEAVASALFAASGDFFLPVDKVQVKYEMLRAHAVDGVSATAAAAAHGYSRAAFYLVAGAFERAGMTGLLDERPGRRGPVKITPEILAFLAQAPAGASGADLAGQIAARFGVELHRRTVERIRRQPWPAAGSGARSGRSGRPRRPTTKRSGRRPWLRSSSGDVAVRRPVRPPRTRRADRLAGGRTGVHRPGAGRCAAPVEPARRPADGRPGRRVRLPARSRHRPGDRRDDGWRSPMKAAIYARVSTDSQQQRGTIGSQLAVLRERLAAEGDELVAEFCDDGHSGARLDRPGLDSLRDAAEAGADRTDLVPVTGPAGPRLRLPGHRARRTGPAPRAGRASPTHPRSTTTRRPSCSPRCRA